MHSIHLTSRTRKSDAPGPSVLQCVLYQQSPFDGGSRHQLHRARPCAFVDGRPPEPLRSPTSAVAAVCRLEERNVLRHLRMSRPPSCHGRHVVQQAEEFIGLRSCKTLCQDSDTRLGPTDSTCSAIVAHMLVRVCPTRSLSGSGRSLVVLSVKAVTGLAVPARTDVFRSVWSNAPLLLIASPATPGATAPAGPFRSLKSKRPDLRSRHPSSLAPGTPSSAML